MLLLIQLHIPNVQSITIFSAGRKDLKYQFIKTAMEKKLLSTKVISFLLYSISLQFVKFCTRFSPRQAA